MQGDDNVFCADLPDSYKRKMVSMALRQPTPEQGIPCDEEVLQDLSSEGKERLTAARLPVRYPKDLSSACNACSAAIPSFVRFHSSCFVADPRRMAGVKNRTMMTGLYWAGIVPIHFIFRLCSLWIMSHHCQPCKNKPFIETFQKSRKK